MSSPHYAEAAGFQGTKAKIRGFCVISSGNMVDDTRKALEWVRTFPITEADILAIGKDPRTAVKFPPEYGFGDNSYVAQLDIFHQLHCLNALHLIAWSSHRQEKKQPRTR